MFELVCSLFFFTLGMAISWPWKERDRSVQGPEPEFPEDTNALRGELFRTSRRLGRLKQEHQRRQREARRAADEAFAKAMIEDLYNPDLTFRNDRGKT